MIPGWWRCDTGLVHAFDLAEYADRVNLIAACGYRTTRDKTQVTSAGPHCPTCLDCLGNLSNGHTQQQMLATVGPVPEEAKIFRLNQARRRRSERAHTWPTTG